MPGHGVEAGTSSGRMKITSKLQSEMAVPHGMRRIWFTACASTVHGRVEADVFPALLGTKYPILPADIRQESRTLYLGGITMRRPSSYLQDEGLFLQESPAGLPVKKFYTHLSVWKEAAGSPLESDAFAAQNPALQDSYLSIQNMEVRRCTTKSIRT